MTLTFKTFLSSLVDGEASLLAATIDDRGTSLGFTNIDLLTWLLVNAVGLSGRCNIVCQGCVGLH